MNKAGKGVRLLKVAYSAGVTAFFVNAVIALVVGRSAVRTALVMVAFIAGWTVLLGVGYAIVVIIVGSRENRRKRE
jgi:hypothetical protein